MALAGSEHQTATVGPNGAGRSAVAAGPSASVAPVSVAAADVAPSTATRVALVIGASRGLGRAIALSLARDGYAVGVAAKSTHSASDAKAGGHGSGGGGSGGSGGSSMPGTVYSVAAEIEAAGGRAIALPCNVLNSADLRRAVDSTVSAFGGRLDTVVYNAGAIWWDSVAATPTKRYDLMHGVNARGAYDTVQLVLPIMSKQNSGRIVLIAPPIYSRFFNGKTPYAMSKLAMTVLAIGLARELALSPATNGVAVCTLWPATAVASAVTEKMNVPLSALRKDSIFADATLAIANTAQSARVNGRALIDEDFLREVYGTDLDFARYRCDPNVEPERMMPRYFPSLLVPEQDAKPVLGNPHQRNAHTHSSAATNHKPKLSKQQTTADDTHAIVSKL